jgi:hypothetical protein
MSFGVIIIEENRGFITKAFVSATIRPVPSAMHANFQSAAEIVGVTGLLI